MASKDQKRKAAAEGSQPSGASAQAANAAQLSVTLGQNRSPLNAPLDTVQSNAAMSPKDVTMESTTPSDPLKTAAAHDGPRASEQANLDRQAAAQIDMAQVVESLEVFGDIP